MRCGLGASSIDVGPILDEAFGGEDVPTRIADPEFVSREAARDLDADDRSSRVRVEKVARPKPRRSERAAQRTERPIPPWVPMSQRSDDIPAIDAPLVGHSASRRAPAIRSEASLIDAPTYDDLPAQRLEAPAGTGFGKGLLIGFGLAGFLFGAVALVGAGVLVYTRGLASSTASAPATLAAATEQPREVAPAPVATPREEKAVAVATPREEKAVALATPVIVAKALPVSTPVVIAKPAPTPVVVAKALPVATPAPRARSFAAAVPRPAPARVVEAPAAAPAPAKPSHDELLSLAISARRAAAPVATPAVTVAAVEPTVTPDPFAAPTATPEMFMPVDEPVAASASANAAPAATPDPELADLLGSPSPAPAAVATPKPVVKAKKVSSKDTGERVIHSRNGDKPVFLNANIALTEADGKTLVGKLLGVVDGFVEVKTSSARLRIAENDVIDAATY